MRKTVMDQLKEISETHTLKRIKFNDGSITCDAWTANTMLCVYNAISEENKLKFADKIQTKNGFIKMANFSFTNTTVKT